jgi:hypothetical protein
LSFLSYLAVVAAEEAMRVAAAEPVEQLQVPLPFLLKLIVLRSAMVDDRAQTPQHLALLQPGEATEPTAAVVTLDQLAQAVDLVVAEEVRALVNRAEALALRRVGLVAQASPAKAPTAVAEQTPVLVAAETGREVAVAEERQITQMDTVHTVSRFRELASTEDTLQAAAAHLAGVAAVWAAEGQVLLE